MALSPGGAPNTFCEPTEMTSIPHASTSTGMLPAQLTESTKTSLPYCLPELRQTLEIDLRPAGRLAVHQPEDLRLRMRLEHGLELLGLDDGVPCGLDGDGLAAVLLDEVAVALAVVPALDVDDDVALIETAHRDRLEPEQGLALHHHDVVGRLEELLELLLSVAEELEERLGVVEEELTPKRAAHPVGKLDRSRRQHELDGALHVPHLPSCRAGRLPVSRALEASLSLI